MFYNWKACSIGYTVKTLIYFIIKNPNLYDHFAVTTAVVLKFQQYIIQNAPLYILQVHTCVYLIVTVVKIHNTRILC